MDSLLYFALPLLVLTFVFFYRTEGWTDSQNMQVGLVLLSLTAAMLYCLFANMDAVTINFIAILSTFVCFPIANFVTIAMRYTLKKLKIGVPFVIEIMTYLAITTATTMYVIKSFIIFVINY